MNSTILLNAAEALAKERDDALELLERMDIYFEGLADQGYINTTERALWADIREYLRPPESASGQREVAG